MNKYFVMNFSIWFLKMACLSLLLTVPFMIWGVDTTKISFIRFVSGMLVMYIYVMLLSAVKFKIYPKEESKYQFLTEGK